MMFRVYLSSFSNQLKRVGLFSCLVFVLLLTASTATAQGSKGGIATPDENGFQFRGVKIGMATEEARKKLGSPKEKSAEQDFYLFNDNEAVQIYYEKGAVSAIAIDYMSGSNGFPTPKAVLGAEAEAKADGSIHKVVRYPKAGYWVSYSRTAGNEPTITITMQKIQ
ncbi:MAG TPA: hypothetical protein VFS84_11290 [Candidatus Binatia bacterium]|nr:hypothetical protein [Candidatus Binatia bacterium]